MPHALRNRRLARVADEARGGYRLCQDFLGNFAIGPLWYDKGAAVHVGIDHLQRFVGSKFGAHLL